MKKCPYCAEWIEEAAIKCKHCHEFLDRPKSISKPPPVPSVSRQRPADDDLPWYFQKSAMLVCLLSAGPLALPMVWWHPRLRWATKLWVSVVVCLLTWGCIWAILKMWAFVVAQWEVLQGI